MPRAKDDSMNLNDMLSFLSDSIQPVSNLNYEPHAKQLDFHGSTLPERLFIGGNRSGKTVGSVNEVIWRITKTHPFNERVNQIQGPVRGRMVCVSFQDGLDKIIIPLFKKWLPIQYWVDGSWDKTYNSFRKTLTLADGSFVEFMSYEQILEKFAGTSRHFVAFDEEPPMPIWQECVMRLMDTEGDWWIAMTPVEGMTWVYNEIYEPAEAGRRPHTLIVKVNTDENPNLTERGKEIAFGSLSEEQIQTRKVGGFNENLGLIYKDYDDSVHLRGPFIPNPKDHPQIYTSLDTGYRHPAVWLWHAVYPDGRVITFHEESHALTTVKDFAKIVHDYEKKLKKFGHNPYDFIRVGDPNGLPQTKEHTGTSIQTEYALNGIYIGTHITREVDVGLIRMTQYLQARTSENKGLWQITEDCPKTIAGIKRYRWDEYQSSKMKYNKASKAVPKKKDDDEVDSLRYFIVCMPMLASGTVQVSRKLSPGDKQELFAEHGGLSFDNGPLLASSNDVVTNNHSYSMEG